MTEVVAALIRDGERFFICQRPAHKARGLLWEFVGGKVEPGETPEAALVRECREELGVTVAVGNKFMDVVHEYPDLTVHLTLFEASIADGIPQKLEHNAFAWITAGEIPEYNFCPADTTILQKIREVFGMNEVYEFLKKCGTYYLATVDGDQPRVRPFGTIDIFDGKLHIQTGKSKDVSRQIHANPKVEICAFDGKQWLRVACKAIENPSIDAQKHMLDAHPSLAAMYKPGDGNTEVFALCEGTATFSSFTAAPHTVEIK